MRYTYKLREDTLIDEDGNHHTVYGIDAYDAIGLAGSFEDIFFDKQYAEAFIKSCNVLGLSLIHLKDVIEDELTRQYTGQ